MTNNKADVEAGTLAPDPAAQFFRVARLLMVSFRREYCGQIIREWVRNNRARRSTANAADDANVQRVFGAPAAPPSQGSGHEEQPKEPLVWLDKAADGYLFRRILFWSFNESCSFFWSWSFLVFLACAYNLISVIILVFKEISTDHYHKWLTGNFIADAIYLIDLFILTRKGWLSDLLGQAIYRIS